jgi:long-chain fatty acid transport protein
MYVMFEDRDYRASKPYQGGGDINGTTAIDGDYSANAHLIGIGVSKSFDLF